MKRRYKKWLEKDWWSFSKCLKGGLRKWVEVIKRRHGAAIIKENQKRELRIIILETGSKEILMWYFRQEHIKKFYCSWNICDYGWIHTWEDYWNGCQELHKEAIERGWGYYMNLDEDKEYRWWLKHYKNKWGFNPQYAGITELA